MFATHTGKSTLATEALAAFLGRSPDTVTGDDLRQFLPCPCCGGRMRIIEVFQPGAMPHAHASPAAAVIRIDTS